mgnify:FL=1
MNILMDFVFFSIIGFISEVIYCSLNKRKSGKALYGPWCPLYGLGGLLIISVVSHVPENMFIIYLVSVLVASFTEYLVSVILEMIFDMKWWDYSFKKFNLNGRICLENSLLFGVLGILIFYFYLPLKVYMISICDPLLLKIIVYLLFTAMCIDGVITIIEAFEVKYRYQLIKKIGLNNKDKLKSKLAKLKSSFNFKRLIYEFDFDNKEKIKFLKKFYKKK